MTMTSGSFNDRESMQTEAILHRFNDVFLKHNPAALPELVADDCVIENTQPAPDGSRHQGKAACVALWTQIATAPGIHFEPEASSRAAIAARSDGGWCGNRSRKLRAWRQSDARSGRADRRSPGLCEGHLTALHARPR
jgi:hypothetical protein